MASVIFENASRIYPGTTAPAVDKLNLTVADGELLVLVGHRAAENPPHFACLQGWKR